MSWLAFEAPEESCDEMNDSRHLIVEHIKGSIFKIKKIGQTEYSHLLKEFTGLLQMMLLELLIYRNA